MPYRLLTETGSSVTKISVRKAYRLGKSPSQEVLWHVRELSDTLRAVSSEEHGLCASEAVSRLRTHGPNRLPQGKPPPLLHVFAQQFRSPLIYVLGIAAILSLALGETTDAGFIAAVLVLNGVIGGVQEWRAERSSRALQQLVRTRATVLRDGEAVEIDSEEVVPGDVVWLESGNRVPADMRLLMTQGLEVDESLMTGESVPASKDARWQTATDTPLGDRRNMAYAGCVVSRGRASGVVVATASATIVGQLARDVTASRGGRPPLLIRLERFTRVVGVSVLVAALAIVVIGTLIRGQGAAEMFLFAVALAVSAIPEGLPVALTVALAVATKRMARRGVIVRKLTAVEGLGSCTIIASDKTGTLTCNELTVRRIHGCDGTAADVTGEGYEPTGEIRALDGSAPARPSWIQLGRAAALCNEGQLHRRNGTWTWRGDPTDVALLAYAHKAGWTREGLLADLPEVNVIPFEPERRYAATFHADGEKTLVVVKGAPERVLDMCSWGDAGPESENRARAVARDLAKQGFRVLAFAEDLREVRPDPEEVPDEPEGLRFLGYAGMIDPLRPEARDAVARCREAGIHVAMVTGDHPITAFAIARDLGLANQESEVVTGTDLLHAEPDERIRMTSSARVFARVSPHQKLEIVRSAQEAGHFVAVTGDGVNDAPALQAANIGVAMGRMGTDVAREAAELVISDDDFSSIVAGVEEGRVAYDNVRKVIYLLASTGAAEMVLVALSLAAGLPLPLWPVQLLWLNLVTNGIQDVALAFEPREKDVLARRPRPTRERIFNQLMVERTVVAAIVMGILGFLAFRQMLAYGWSEREARNGLLLLMVLFESVHIGNCRSETVSLFRLSPLRSPILLTGAVAAFLIHVIAMHLPAMQKVLSVGPVEPRVWILLMVTALLIAAVMELHKWTWKLRHKHRLGDEKLSFVRSTDSQPEREHEE